MKLAIQFPIALIALLLFAGPVYSQIERTRVVTERPAELVFPTPRHINLMTTEPLSAGELYYSIMHAFSTVENGITDFFGLDSGANVRFSLEYGFTDRFSAFIGRSSLDKVYEAGFRYHILRQMTDDSMPVSMTLAVTGGIMTEDFTVFPGEKYSIDERLNAGISLPVSRKFSESFSLMVSPMFAVFSSTDMPLRIENTADDTYFGLGSGFRYKVASRTSVTFQHVAAFRAEADQVSHNFGLGLDLETGGHVFQLFLITSNALNDQYLLAAANGKINDYGFRFGFNVNRSFSLR